MGLDEWKFLEGKWKASSGEEDAFGESVAQFFYVFVEVSEEVGSE